MKFRSFFDVIGDAKDVAEFFEGVETVEQMVSKLERIKRRDAEEFLVCVQSMKISVEQALEDTLEMGSTFEPGDEPDEGDEGNELSDEEFGDLENEEDETETATEGESEKKPEAIAAKS